MVSWVWTNYFHLQTTNIYCRPGEGIYTVPSGPTYYGAPVGATYYPSTAALRGEEDDWVPHLHPPDYLVSKLKTQKVGYCDE